MMDGKPTYSRPGWSPALQSRSQRVSMKGGPPRPPRAGWMPFLFVAFVVATFAPIPTHAQFFDDRNGVPKWEIDPRFKHDTFSIARLRYTSWGGRGRGGGWGGWGGGGGDWRTDAPDAELNLSFRLQQMTSLKVNPELTYVDISDETLSRYPFLYMVEPGRLMFRDEDVVTLQKYFRKGGFLMVDDFWGEQQWANFHEQIKRVFPDREPVDLPIEHPIFHCVFDLKEKPQMPAIGWFTRGGVTWEVHQGEECRDVHFRGIFDDKGRMMVFISHNNDFGDGWEREGEDQRYFERFSEKQAYPMAINILFYAMTH